MILNSIDALDLVCVLDRGIPNQECIAIFVRDTAHMGQYGIMVGVSQPNGLARPLYDNLFWFSEGTVNKGDWIFVYTGGGEVGATKGQQEGTMSYVLHWGKNETVFANSGIVPILFRVDAVRVDKPVANQKQIGSEIDQKLLL